MVQQADVALGRKAVLEQRVETFWSKRSDADRKKEIFWLSFGTSALPRPPTQAVLNALPTVVRLFSPEAHPSLTKAAAKKVVLSLRRQRTVAKKTLTHLEKEANAVVIQLADAKFLRDYGTTVDDGRVNYRRYAQKIVDARANVEKLGRSLAFAQARLVELGGSLTELW